MIIFTFRLDRLEFVAQRETVLARRLISRPAREEAVIDLSEFANKAIRLELVTKGPEVAGPTARGEAPKVWRVRGVKS